MSAGRYSDPIHLARQAVADLRAAQRRYRIALREALPPDTPIRFTAHDGRSYDGVIVRWPELGTGVVVRNRMTGHDYEINVHWIEGLAS